MCAFRSSAHLNTKIKIRITEKVNSNVRWEDGQTAVVSGRIIKYDYNDLVNTTNLDSRLIRVITKIIIIMIIILVIMIIIMIRGKIRIRRRSRRKRRKKRKKE